jgi:predicted nucleotidyltransferase
MPTRREYDLAAERVKEIAERLYVQGKIRSAFLYGSYVINEYVPGFSDVDVFVALPREKIEKEVYKELNELSNVVAHQFDIHCNYQIRGGKIRVDPFISWLLSEYNLPLVGIEPKQLLGYDKVKENWKSSGELFAQKIIPKYVSELQKVLLQVGSDRTSFKNVPLPPSVLKRGIDYRLEMGGLIIDRVLDITMYGNLLFNDFAYRREEFVAKGITYLQGIVCDTQIIQKCLELRTNWKNVRVTDLDVLIMNAPDFTEDIAEWMRRI